MGSSVERKRDAGKQVVTNFNALLTLCIFKCPTPQRMSKCASPTFHTLNSRGYVCDGPDPILCMSSHRVTSDNNQHSLYVLTSGHPMHDRLNSLKLVCKSVPLNRSTFCLYVDPKSVI